MKISFVFCLLAVFLFCQGAVAQNLPKFSKEWRSLEEAQENGEHVPVPRGGEEDGGEVVVPDEYPDIQDAVNSGARFVRVRPGVYLVGNLRISGRCLIYAEIPGTVLLVGNNTGNTIELAWYADVILEGLRIINSQIPGPYNRATIFGEFGGRLGVFDSEIYSTSIGISVNYLSETTINSSWFFGGQDATGIKVSHSNPLSAGGTTLVNNVFFSVGTGIDASSSYTRFRMCPGREGQPPDCDSNAYYSVARPFIPQRELMD